MNKQFNFLTEEFYTNPFKTIEIFNELVTEVSDKEMYGNGTFLFLEVFDNDNSRKILSSIINDIDKYIVFNNKKYPESEYGFIGLCALQEEHTRHFDSDYEIMWDNEDEMFFKQKRL